MIVRIGGIFGSVPYVLLFIVHMDYDIHDRVYTTVDSHKYYDFFANSHMFYYLSLVSTTVQDQSLISSTFTVLQNNEMDRQK